MRSGFPSAAAFLRASHKSNIHGMFPKRISLASGLSIAWNLANWAGVNSVTASLTLWFAAFGSALACAWGGGSASAWCMRKPGPVNVRQAGSTSAGVLHLDEDVVSILLALGHRHVPNRLLGSASVAVGMTDLCQMDALWGLGCDPGT